jgi:hypothetical protein
VVSSSSSATITSVSFSLRSFSSFCTLLRAARVRPMMMYLSRGFDLRQVKKVQDEKNVKKSNGCWILRLWSGLDARQTSHVAQENSRRYLGQEVSLKKVPRAFWSLHVLYRSHESRRVPASQVQYSTSLIPIGQIGACQDASSPQPLERARLR